MSSLTAIRATIQERLSNRREDLRRRQEFALMLADPRTRDEYFAACERQQLTPLTRI